LGWLYVPEFYFGKSCDLECNPESHDWGSGRIGYPLSFTVYIFSSANVSLDLM